jgi:hypothetical protein
VAACLVCSQLDLFTHGSLALNTRGSCHWKMSDRERDRRTGGQWLRAVKAYLEFGAGSAWRRLSDPEQRNSPVRDWYLGGIRTMNGISVRDPLAQDGRGGVANLSAGVCATRFAGIRAAAPPRVPSSPVRSSPVARLTASRNRGWIVEELLRVNPALTDKKLLLRLSHLKLAEMLVTARRASSSARSAAKKQRPRILPKPPKRVVPPQSFPVPLRGAA